MKPTFQDARAETMSDFLALVKGWRLVFYYVYDSPTANGLLFELPDPEPGELYLAFNLAQHGEEGRRGFREVSMIEQRLGEPPLRRLPYWGSFVVGMGPYSIVYTIDDARTMVHRAREEMRKLWKAFEKK